VSECGDSTYQVAGAPGEEEAVDVPAHPDGLQLCGRLRLVLDLPTIVELLNLRWVVVLLEVL
jgi:hypothetical protein